MNKARLLLLADALRHRIPPEKFDLTSWRFSPPPAADEDDDPNENATDDDLRHACGTTACAIGWACALPEFKEEGLSWEAGGAMPLYTWGDGHFRTGWDAVEKFFNIDYGQARHFFGSEKYNRHAHPEQVAGRIEAVVRNTRES